MLLLPWHLTDRLADGFGVTVPAGTVEVEGAPGSTGDPWLDLVGVYAGLAEAVATQDEQAVHGVQAVQAVRGEQAVQGEQATRGGRDGEVTVLSGDCVSALAVLAGLQRRGLDPAVVWFDAHGDFHTEETTTSGYLGGLPLAKMVGLGDLALPTALGMSPVAQDRVVLVDGRDLDPPEAVVLGASDVAHVPIADLAPEVLPDGPLLLHVDLDVFDPADVGGVRCPAPGGPGFDAVIAGIRTVAASRRLAALSVAVAWRPVEVDPVQGERVLAAVLAAAGR